MKFSVALFSILLLVTATHAVPQLETQKTSSWTGIHYYKSPSGNIDTITGTFTVPDISIPSGDVSDIFYQCSFWVGISNPDHLLQTGVLANIAGDGTPY